MSEANAGASIGGDNGGTGASDNGGNANGNDKGAGVSAAPSSWTDGFSAENVAWIQTQGIKDAHTAIEGYRNLQKLTGGGLDRIVQLPKDNADEKGYRSMYAKLGMPEKPEDYIIDAPKEGADENFIKWTRGEFHKLGLSKEQGTKLSKAWNEYANTQIKTMNEAAITEGQGQLDALKREWGTDYPVNVERGTNAAKTFGVSKDDLTKIESALGFAKTMKLFQTIGTKLGEGEYVTGAGGIGNTGHLTKEQAQNRIGMLRADSEFITAYLAGGAKETTEMNRLMMIANPESEPAA